MACHTKENHLPSGVMFHFHVCWRDGFLTLKWTPQGDYSCIISMSPRVVFVGGTGPWADERRTVGIPDATSGPSVE